jgi:cytidylate kinase
MAALVEREVRNWELRRHQPLGEHLEPQKTLKFYIAISRESGCSEDEISDKLAQLTGFEKFDRQLLDYMVTKEDIRRQLYESLDDRTMSWIESVLSNLSFGPTVNVEEYFNRLCHAIYAICYNTHAIIVGRGANYILPRENGLAVRLVAPYDFRLKNFAKQTGMDLAQAAKTIRTVEKWRGQFVEDHFGRFAFDPRRFDLVINISQFTPDDVAAMIAETLKARVGDTMTIPLKKEKKPAGRG